jgi:hypothetical protein
MNRLPQHLRACRSPACTGLGVRSAAGILIPFRALADVKQAITRNQLCQGQQKRTPVRINAGSGSLRQQTFDVKLGLELRWRKCLAHHACLHSRRFEINLRKRQEVRAAPCRSGPHCQSLPSESASGPGQRSSTAPALTGVLRTWQL